MPSRMQGSREKGALLHTQTQPEHDSFPSLVPVIFPWIMMSQRKGEKENIDFFKDIKNKTFCKLGNHLQ